RASVMGVQHKEPEYLKVVLLADLPDGEKVSKRFRHLPVVNIQESIVHPVSGKSFSIAALRLSNLILMMGEDQVFSSCMDINFFSQIFFGHYRAFNMPAGTSFSPGRYPVRFSFFFRLP